MANLFKQSRGKSKSIPASSAKKRRTSANAQIAGLRFSRQGENAPKEEAQKPDTENNQGQVKRVTLDNLDWMGQGVVRTKPVMFVQGALPGETCDVEIISSKKQVAMAKVSKVVIPAPERREPFCPVYARCGGCQLQHIAPDEALSLRDSALKHMLMHQLSMREEAWQPPLVGERPQYRRKARLAIDARNPDNPKLGFREANSNSVVNIGACPILVDPLKNVIGPLQQAIQGYDTSRHIGHIGLMAGENFAQITVKHTKALEGELIDSLIAVSKAHNMALVLENKKGELQERYYPSSTAQKLTVSIIDGFSLAPAPNDFIQINKQVNQKMVAQALDWLSPVRGERIADWFCGLGNFTLPIANRGALVQAIEGVAEMVMRAKVNAQHQGITNVDWLHLDLSDKANVEASLDQNFDKVLLDPSREGALTVCHALVKATPKAIVYVSCNPSTFSRDAKVLLDGGYEMEKAGVIEMFPFTHHMEMMALFTRKQQ